MVVRLEKSFGCCRLCGLQIDAMLHTDVNGFLSGIVTDKDIATRVIAEGLRVEQTIISKIMTRSPLYVIADAFAIGPLQKMVEGSEGKASYRHIYQFREQKKS